MRLVPAACAVALAATLIATAAPAASGERAPSGLWTVAEDGPLGCVATSGSEKRLELRVILDTKDRLTIVIGSADAFSLPVTLALNGNTYPFKSLDDPATAAPFLSDLAAGDALELRFPGGGTDRVSLRGSAAAVEQLRRCTAALDARLQQELASGALVLPSEVLKTALERPEPAETRGDVSRAQAQPPGLGALIRDADYPLSALRRGAEGTVAFRLDIRADGRVGQCTVTASSGALDLDVATCRIMSERARFAPARNAAGEAVPDSAQARIIWRIADPEPPPIVMTPQSRLTTPGAGASWPRLPLQKLISARDYPAEALEAREEGTVKLSLAVSAEGRVTGCFVLGSSGSPALDRATCQLLRARARFEPARDADGKPETGIHSARIVWKLPAAASPAPAGPGPERR